MQLFLADCQFPDIENQVKAYHLFVEAWESGEIAKSDKTDKFDMLFRVHAPGEGRVVCLCKAQSDKEIFDLNVSGAPNLGWLKLGSHQEACVEFTVDFDN